MMHWWDISIESNPGQPPGRSQKTGVDASLKISLSCMDGATRTHAFDNCKAAYPFYRIYGRPELGEANNRGTRHLQGNGGLGGGTAQGRSHPGSVSEDLQ